MQMMVCASPAYAAIDGLPRRIDELARHRCINLRTASGRIKEWEFKVDGHTQRHRVASRHTVNDAGLMLQAVLDGLGIAQLPAYLVCDLLAGGQLIHCLGHHAPDDGAHYICYLSRKHLPARIRVFVDYMTEHTRALDLQCLPTMRPTPPHTQSPVHA